MEAKEMPVSCEAVMAMDRGNPIRPDGRSELLEMVMYRAEARDSSKSISNKLIWFLLCTVVTTPFALAQQKTITGKVTLAQMVARLGADGNDDIADVKRLAVNPRASVELLIAGLHPIPDSDEFGKAENGSTEHVLWMIRGLRYLTGGMDFCARSRHVFGQSDAEKNRKYWLTFQHGGCLTFFGYWMSRDRIYIAPSDVQENIISQWQRWYATYGAKFEYKTLQSPPPDKWLW